MTTLADDALDIADGIRNRSWVDVSLGGVGVSLEALSLVVDPLGGLFSWGVGWLLEHVGPLREALDQLAGDASAVAGQAAVWQGVADRMAAAGSSYAEQLWGVAGWGGAAGDAYRAHAGEQVAVLSGVGAAAGGIAAAVEGAGLLVALVREIVRDLIAEFVATLAVRLPQWLAMEGLTLGVATPFVAGQVSGLVLEWVNRIQRFIRGLLDSLRRLVPKTDALREILDRLVMQVRRLGGGSGSGGKGDASPAGSPSPMPPAGPPWRARDDIPGPARGKELGPPHARHTIAGAKRGMVKPKNTIILPGYEEVVRDDIRRIAAGEAAWNSDVNFYEINGRTYNVKPNGTVFPGTGEGFVLLDRNEYLALQKVVQADGDVDNISDFQRNPRFSQNPDIIAKAKSIYDGTYQQ